MLKAHNSMSTSQGALSLSIVYRRSVLCVLHSLLPACVSMLFFLCVCVFYVLADTDQSSATITSRFSHRLTPGLCGPVDF